MHDPVRPPNRLGRITGLLALAVLALLALPSLAAAAKDRNHDKIPDRWEKQHNLSLNVNQARRDQDSDNLVNLKEFRGGMDPRDGDSDDDGIDDSDEGAGTIASFDPATGELTIDTFGQGTATGLVTDVTEISCDSGDDDATDDHGGHGNEPGDDHGGQGNGGDDPSGSNSEDEPGHGGHGGDDRALRSDDGGVPCTTDDLQPGAPVHEAELELEHGTATWSKVELLK
jgi:hypothetical protein